jgi:hypothetical protein
MKWKSVWRWNPQAGQMSAPIASPPEVFVWPVTADRFFVATPTYNPIRITFGLRDTSGHVIVAERMLTADGNTFPLAAWPLPRDHFLIFYRSGENLYAQVFNRDFSPVQEAFLPFPQATPRAERPALEVFQDRVVFAISDVRRDGSGRDIYASVYDAQRLITTVAEKSASQKLPHTFTLQPIAPNPLQNHMPMKLRFMLSRAGVVSFHIYDVLGRLVQQFAAQPFTPGAHEISLSLARHAAGVYFLRAENEGQTAVKKFLLIANCVYAKSKKLLDTKMNSRKKKLYQDAEKVQIR